MNILLIEDDKDLCLALSCRLGQDGHRTDCCHNGREAELYIRQEIYDLILLDCMLPEKDGIHILKSMRAEGNLSFGDLSLDPAENRLSCKDKNCSLSQTESELMGLLLRTGEKTANRTVLLHKIWGLDLSLPPCSLPCSASAFTCPPSSSFPFSFPLLPVSLIRFWNPSGNRTFLPPNG